jgi:prevent-host-death family protein
MVKSELVTTLKREATRLIAEIRKARTPVLITQHGKPVAYLVDAESFEALEERLRILEGIARGERAIQEGRVVTHRQARRRMARWLD